MESFGINLQRLAVQFPPFMMAVIFHEFAHGFVANYWGDTTAKDQGRLTLNPAPHVDIFGTLLFPALGMVSGLNFLFGWAKPVPIDPRRFKKYRPGLFWVSLAGPGMNCLLAVLSAMVCYALLLWAPQGFWLRTPLLEMSKASVFLNFWLAIFNLLPIPPLDGSKIIESFLSYNATRKYEALSQYSLWILIALMMTGAFSLLSYPIGFLSASTFMGVGKLFGVSPYALFE